MNPLMSIRMAFMGVAIEQMHSPAGSKGRQASNSVDFNMIFSYVHILLGMVDLTLFSIPMSHI